MPVSTPRTMCLAPDPLCLSKKPLSVNQRAVDLSLGQINSDSYSQLCLRAASPRSLRDMLFLSGRREYSATRINTVVLRRLGCNLWLMRLESEPCTFTCVLEYSCYQRVTLYLCSWHCSPALRIVFTVWTVFFWCLAFVLCAVCLHSCAFVCINLIKHAGLSEADGCLFFLSVYLFSPRCVRWVSWFH